MINYDHQHYDQAKDLFSEAIKRGYISADIYYSLGQANTYLQANDEAIAAFQNAVALYQGYPGAHYQLGECYRLKGENDLAQLEYIKEVNSNPSFKSLCEIGLQKLDGQLSPNEERGVKPTSVNWAKVAEFINSGRDFIPGTDIDEIKRKFGNPANERVEPCENRHHKGQMDEIHTLEYEGFIIKVCRVNEVPPRELVSELTITGKKYSFKYGLKIGSPRRMIIDIFGQPHIDKKQATFATRVGVVYFYFSNEELEKVRWQWYID